MAPGPWLPLYVVLVTGRYQDGNGKVTVYPVETARIRCSWNDSRIILS